MTNQCKNCQNLNMATDELTCTAFPNGIPKEILIGEFDHTKEYKNDNNIRFKKV